MKDKYSSAERISRLFSGQSIDKIPFMPGLSMFSGIFSKLKPQEFFLDEKKMYESQKLTNQLFSSDSEPSFDLPGWMGMDLGSELYFPDCSSFCIPQLKYAITNLDEAEKFTLTDYKEGLGFQKRKKFIDISMSDGVYGNGIAMVTGSILEVLSMILDPILLLKWMKKEPATVHKLEELIFKYLLQIIDDDIETYGIENCSSFAFFPFESSKIISLDLFKEFSYPYTIRMHEELKKRGVENFSIHLCGRHTDDLEYFKELNLPPRSCITVDEQTDIVKVSKIFGDDYIIGGNVSSTTLLTGNFQDVYNASRDVIEKMKYHKGGYILMPSCDMPPNTPPLNVYAMFCAIRDFGYYE